MTLWIDRTLNLVKWPVALISIGNLWFLLQQDIALVLSTFGSSHQHFWLGMVVYLLVWRFFLASRLFGSWFPTLIHELIHALFAILTLHRVTGFSVTWKEGGHMQYVGGEGNWLITIAPYFFPLTTLIALFAETFVELSGMQRSMFLGAVFGFEIIYVWRQIHPKQTDFQKVGMTFVWLFLPSAILFGYGVLLSFLLLGPTGAETFAVKTWSHTVSLMNDILAYGQQLVARL